MTTILINGIDGLLGARIAQLLSAEPSVRLLGLGHAPPPAPVGRAEWLVADLSAPQLVELLRAEGVETVIHLAFLGAERPAPNREAAVQQNVLGSMELLGACTAAGVRRVVLRSHTGVYGASPLNPTFICEDRPLANGLGGLLRDYVEVEQFVAEFAPRHPELAVVRLRCAPLIGAWSPLVRYLTRPAPPMLAGFDPCLQLLHLDDAAAAFVAAATGKASGAFNLAAEDTVCLSQLIRLAGQQPMAVLEPILAASLALGNRAALGDWPFDLSFMRHSWVADTSRARAELGWAPARSAVDSLVALRANGHISLDRAANEAALRSFLSRRSQP
jgi:UDP-glucose 4-epimerase